MVLYGHITTSTVPAVGGQRRSELVDAVPAERPIRARELGESPTDHVRDDHPRCEPPAVDSIQRVGVGVGGDQDARHGDECQEELRRLEAVTRLVLLWV